MKQSLTLLSRLSGVALVLAMYGCTSPQADDPIPQPEAMNMEETMAIALDECGAAHENAHGVPGRLSVEMDAEGKIRWTCVMSSHHICYAGEDGVWDECTFEPVVMEWPVPVRASLLSDPSLLLEWQLDMEEGSLDGGLDPGTGMPPDPPSEETAY